MAIESLATTAQLAERLPFVMDTDETREAVGALQDLSDEARHYGRPTWENATVTPQPVIGLVLKAAVRHMKNYEGHTSSRAGDEAVAWAERSNPDSAGSAEFTAEERGRIREYAGNRKPSLMSVNTFAATRPGTCRRPTPVPTEDGSPFPYPSPSW